MLKDLFTNRLFVGALAFFMLIVVSGTLYLRHIERQGKIELERTRETPKRLEERNPKPPAVDASQGGHRHADGTWHDEPHEPPAVTPEATFESLSDAELAEIPEDIPMPDIPLPDDDMDAANVTRWAEKHTAEWQKYVHAFDPQIKRLTAEINQMTAELPPENSPDFAAAKAKLRAKKEEHSKIRAEQNARVHQWAASSEAFGDYVTERANSKRK